MVPRYSLELSCGSANNAWASNEYSRHRPQKATSFALTLDHHLNDTPKFECARSCFEFVILRPLRLARKGLVGCAKHRLLSTTRRFGLGNDGVEAFFFPTHSTPSVTWILNKIAGLLTVRFSVGLLLLIGDYPALPIPRRETPASILKPSHPYVTRKKPPSTTTHLVEPGTTHRSDKLGCALTSSGASPSPGRSSESHF